jgi:hypothetical protein
VVEQLEILERLTQQELQLTAVQVAQFLELTQRTLTLIVVAVAVVVAGT